MKRMIKIGSGRMASNTKIGVVLKMRMEKMMVVTMKMAMN